MNYVKRSSQRLWKFSSTTVVTTNHSMFKRQSWKVTFLYLSTPCFGISELMFLCIFAINWRFSEYVDGKVLHYSWVWLMAMKNAKPKHEKKYIYLFCSSLIDVWERKGKKWALTWNYLNKYSPKSKYYLE